MKRWVRVLLTILAVFLFIAAGTWVLACLFAAGQLYNSYNLWQFFWNAPVASLILVGLLGSCIALVVFLIKKK